MAMCELQLCVAYRSCCFHLFNSIHFNCSIEYTTILYLFKSNATVIQPIQRWIMQPPRAGVRWNWLSKESLAIHWESNALNKSNWHAYGHFYNPLNAAVNMSIWIKPLEFVAIFIGIFTISGQFWSNFFHQIEISNSSFENERKSTGTRRKFKLIWFRLREWLLF